MNEWFETHPFLKQMRRRLSVELAVCLRLFAASFWRHGMRAGVSGGGRRAWEEKAGGVPGRRTWGFDPGKVSVDGSLEKDINLAIAKRLKWYLEQSDVEVVMSREDDRGLYDTSAGKPAKCPTWKNRCARVEESGADLVVSIHQNSYHQEDVSGAQVILLPEVREGETAGGNTAEALRLCTGRPEPQKSQTE